MQRLATRPLVSLAALVLLAGCPQATEEPKLCDIIPEGGCPLDRGGTCDDASCDAIYGCYDGVWEKVETCDTPPTGGGGSGGGGGGSGGEGGCAPFVFDHTGETIGCQPDLQSPDCPIAAAEQCPESACLTDCSDFYLCKEEGWVALAYCDENGELFEAPR